MDNDQIWLICSECGYNVKAYPEQISGYYECPSCHEGRMILDLNQGRKLDHDHIAHDEPIGDNVPDLSRRHCVANDFINFSEELKFRKLPKITKEEIDDFIIDLETKKAIIEWKK